MTFLDDEPEITREEYARLERQGALLYELRLKELDENRDNDDRRGRIWASSCFGEAMLVLEHCFGEEGAQEVAQAMLKARREWTGPRYKRMRQ